MPARSLPRLGLIAAAALAAGALVAGFRASAKPHTPTLSADDPADRKLQPAPELSGGVAWLNAAGPVTLKDLRGKVVILDFWTLCCINCIHVMPDLAKLEKKYPNELVVIGVHSPKFDHEKDTNAIRKAVLRYELAHPVVNDANRAIWDAYGVQSWPTLVMIDPEGNLIGQESGEGHYDLFDKVIAKVIETHKAKKTLVSGPVRFDLARYRETGDTPLFFPGKLLADAATDRLYVSDSTHHRVVVSTLAGKYLATVGTGAPGKTDGPATRAQFDDPQGLALDGNTLYVADRKNHSLRAVDLKTMTVRTVAGKDGVQAQETRALETPQPGTRVGLNSPWDLRRVGRALFVAMAGHHQIWRYDLDSGDIGPFAGNGAEDIVDGPLRSAGGFRRGGSSFAQPSGLTDDGQFLYVADSEVSAVRKVPLSGQGEVETIVGEGLFRFGDVDGVGRAVRLQHALAVAAVGDKLIVADTYNSKLKTLDPKTRECRTLALKAAPGEPAGPLFDEPAGLSVANNKLYVADTNAHRVRVVDLQTNTVATLPITGLAPPPLPREWAPPTKTAPAAEAVKTPTKPAWYDQAVKSFAVKCDPAEAKPGQVVTLSLELELKDGFTAYPLAQPDPAASGQISEIKYPAPGAAVFVGPTPDPAGFKVKPEPALGIKELRYYTGRAVWQRKFVVNPAQAPGDITLNVPGVRFSICDPKEGCFPPRPFPAVATLKVLPGPAVPVDPAFAAEVTAALAGK